jgi:hypothetical protein
MSLSALSAARQSAMRMGHNWAQLLNTYLVASAQGRLWHEAAGVERGLIRDSPRGYCGHTATGSLPLSPSQGHARKNTDEVGDDGLDGGAMRAAPRVTRNDSK